MRFPWAHFGLITLRYQRGLVTRFEGVENVARQREIDLRESEALLMHSQKMEALGNLSAGVAISNIVCVPSAQVPRLFRVQAGNPDSSYLVLKVEGDAGAVGGMATRMPLGFPRLSAQEIAAIRAWILAGAPPPN